MTAFYLAPFIGAGYRHAPGRARDPFRPRVAAPNWTVYAARRPYDTREGRAIVEVDEPQRDSRVLLIGHGRFDTLGPTLRRAIASELRLKRVTARTVEELLVSLGHPPHDAAERRHAGMRRWLQRVGQRLYSLPRWELWEAAGELFVWWPNGMVTGNPMGGGSALATDNFNRAAEDPLAGNWSTQTNLLPFRLNNPENDVTPDISSDSGANYNAITWPNDQYAQIEVTLTGTNGNGAGFGPAVRMAAAAETFLSMVCDHAASNNVTLTRAQAGSYDAPGARTQSFTNGAVAYLEIQGKAALLKLGGTSLTPAITATGIASGRAGMRYSSSETDARGDNFEGGDFAAGGSTAQRTLPNRNFLDGIQHPAVRTGGGLP
jgi:hypothetical protein